jgi:hypothetical protein
MLAAAALTASSFGRRVLPTMICQVFIEPDPSLHEEDKLLQVEESNWARFQ